MEQETDWRLKFTEAYRSVIVQDALKDFIINEVDKNGKERNYFFLNPDEMEAIIVGVCSSIMEGDEERRFR